MRAIQGTAELEEGSEGGEGSSEWSRRFSELVEEVDRRQGAMGADVVDDSRVSGATRLTGDTQ